MTSAALPSIRIAAGLVVDVGGRMLLVRKRGTTAFIQPGGKIEPGEASADALIRELREELGLIVPVSALTPLGQFQAAAANEPNSRVDAHVFVAALPHAVQPAAELDELAWLAPSGEHPHNIAPLLREQVLPALLAHLG